MNKRLEISFFIHILVFLLIFYVAFDVYNINIFNELEKLVNDSNTVLKQEIIRAADLMYEDPMVELDKNGLNLEIEEYKALNLNLIDEARYMTNYYMPAFIAVFIVLLVILENYLINNIIYAYNNLTYDDKKDKNKTKLKRIIRQKLNFKYRKVSIPRKIPILYISCLIIKLIFVFDSGVIARALDNFMFIGMIIITFYGLRIVINFFKTKSSMVRTLIIMLNVFMGILYPQIYFMIGLFESIFNVRIIIKKKIE